jgi:hypothetical protein
MDANGMRTLALLQHREVTWKRYSGPELMAALGRVQPVYVLLVVVT